MVICMRKKLCNTVRQYYIRAKREFYSFVELNLGILHGVIVKTYIYQLLKCQKVLLLQHVFFCRTVGVSCEIFRHMVNPPCGKLLLVCATDILLM